MPDVECRLKGDRVLLRGRMRRGQVVVLEPGFRPGSDQHRPAASASGSTTVTIKPDGLILTTSDAEWVSLDGIEFPVAT